MYIVVVLVWVFLALILSYFIFTFVRKRLRIRKENLEKQQMSEKREEALKEFVQRAIVIGKCIDTEIPKFETVIRSTFNIEFSRHRPTQSMIEMASLHEERKRQEEIQMKEKLMSDKMIGMLIEPGQMDKNKNF